MTHKQQILNALEKETAICKRLYTIIPKEMYSYAPQPGMRTTFKLLQYLSWNALSCVENFMETDPDKQKGIYRRNEEYGESMKAEEFPARMNEEISKINSLLQDVSDDELLSREVISPWREPKLLGEALIETSVKWLTGYKMQLYLYMKMNGMDIDTGDCWIVTE